METKKTILVVQEENKIQTLIASCIDDKISRTIINNVNRAFQLIEQRYFDLIILNIHYKTGNAFELCQRIKSETGSKIIFVSSSDKIEIKEKCFQEGADDFVSMPFYPKELSLRINRLLNLYNMKNILDIKEKGIQLNTLTKTLEVNRCTVNLSPTEYLIMEYLLQNNRPYNSQGLTDYIESRKNKHISIGSVIVQIKRLRFKLQRGTGMNIIKTRYGVGYYIGI